jgi:hypothetical protein
MDTMPSASDQSPDAGIEFVRRHRAELRDSMSALERALAAPAPGRTTVWAQRVHAALADVSADFRTHVEIAEGPDGLHEAVLAVAPRLANAVARLSREHLRLRALIDESLARVGDLTAGPHDGAGVEATRDRGTVLLADLIRHRQSSADVVFEAYEVDIGGEA